MTYGKEVSKSKEKLKKLFMDSPYLCRYRSKRSNTFKVYVLVSFCVICRHHIYYACKERHLYNCEAWKFCELK